MKGKNSKIVLWIVLVVLVLGASGVGYYFYSKKDDSSNNSEKDNKEDVISEDEYLKIGDDIKILRSKLKLSKNAKVNSSETDAKNGLMILDVVEPDFQFETHYLLCFDKDINLVFEARDITDKENGNNRYKFNGKFKYDENAKTLTFNTNIFLGESDEATGASFNDKTLSELTSAEKKTLGNYSDEVKYT